MNVYARKDMQVTTVDGTVKMLMNVLRKILVIPMPLVLTRRDPFIASASLVSLETV